MKGWLWLVLLLLLALPARARELTMRVLLSSGKEFAVAASEAAIVTDGNGQALGYIDAKTYTVVRDGGQIQETGQLWIRTEGLVWLDGRWYEGDLQLVRTADGMLAVNWVELEDYLASVVGSEMISSWPLEALKAQAVAARSYALYERETSPSPYWDIRASEGDQMYLGLERVNDRTRHAVEKTRGVVLSHDGAVAAAFYSACTGGDRTLGIDEAWGVAALPYLRSVPSFDIGCDTFIGHGIGLSQYGAKKLAEDGMPALSILGHYYPGAEATTFKVREKN